MHVESGAPLDDPFQAPLLPTLGVPAPSALLASLPRGASCSKESSVRALVKGNNSGCLEARASHFSTGFVAPPVLNKPTSVRQRRAHFHPFGVALQEGHDHFSETQLPLRF